MKIKKLEIVGFKSFVDRTAINFDHDITGIVGPNGCGKSNVVDAIKWVMGEQSASRLRGKAMDDVIFNGCETRGPAGFAEVAITFDNTDGLTPPEYRDYAEITIARRLDRQGRSDYFINKTPVRLMDVTNLFLGTGVGRRAYSIIEQGRIGFIVSSKPEDRRQMIEEAAGITKFKVRKKAAERKMDQTRQNLLRVTDIIGELERNLASLQRQAQKAERYKRYRAEQRDLELHVAAFKFLEIHTEAQVVARSLAEANAEVEGSRDQLRVQEAEVEAARADLQGIGVEVDRAQSHAYELDNRVRMLEAQIEQLVQRLAALRDQEAMAERELSEVGGQRQELLGERGHLEAALEQLEAVEEEARGVLEVENDELSRRRLGVEEAEQAVANARARHADANTRIARGEAVLAGFERRREDALARQEKLRGERDDLAGRTVDLEQERGEIEARLEGLQSGKEQTAERREQVEAELVALREELHTSDETVERLREELATKRSRLESLRELQQRFEGVGAGVRALMTRFADTVEGRAAKGVLGLVADRLEAPHELTPALAGALGDRLQHIVVDDVTAGVRAVDFLKTDARGRATLVPRTPRAEAADRPRLADGEGVVGPLADLLRFAPEDAALVRHLVGDVVVVEDLAAALRLHEGGPVDATLVTLEGEVLDRDGTLTGGAADDAGAHMLEMKREMRELDEVVRRLDGELGTAMTRHGELRNGIAQRQAEIDAARTAAHDAEIGIVKAEKDLRRVDEDLERVRGRIDDVASEITDLAYALEQADDEEAEARSEIDAARHSADEAEEALGAADAVCQERREAVEEQAARVTEVQVRAAEARQRVQSDRNALERLDRSLVELANREERLHAAVLQSAGQQGRVSGEIVGARESLLSSVDAARRAQEGLAQTRARYDEAQNAVGEREVALKELRATIDAVGGRANELALRDRELAMALEHLLESVTERHDTDIRRVMTDYHDRDLPDAAVLNRIEELTRLISRMGEINLMAIEEYEEKAKRYEYLSGQKTDLEDALAQLERAIRQMNRESRAMFKEAFVGINERFKLLFPTLFRGGKAELKLSNPDDILESGVEIIAQPPGKKLGSLELMSGGEKALTAVAMIFAIFQYKPSPFCLLDEVDAPLDEANIARFADAINQMTDRSQFIVITHSKRTMEYTDVLYGVTMEQPGISKLVAVELRGRKTGEVPNRAAVA